MSLPDVTISVGRRPCLRRARLFATRGTILVIVLVTILFVSVALFAFMEKASNDLLVETREADAARLRMEAQSALETVLAVLEEFRRVNNGLRSPAEGWSDPLGFAGYEPGEGRVVKVEFQDESGKLSLPAMNAAGLTQLFETWQIPKSDAELLADALLGWMRSDYTASSARAPKSDDYEREELPYLPPERPLRSYSELATIAVVREQFFDESGRPNDYYRKFCDAVSLYRFQQPNVNGAGNDTLSVLGVQDQSQHQRMDDFRRGIGSFFARGPGYFKNAGEAASLLGPGASNENYGVEIRALRIRVTVSRGAASYVLSAVIAPPGGAELVPPMEERASRTGGATKAQAAPTPTPAPSRGVGASGNSSKKLNYPFTLLEFTENVVMSVTHTPNTDL